MPRPDQVFGSGNNKDNRVSGQERNNMDRCQSGGSVKFLITTAWLNRS